MAIKEDSKVSVIVAGDICPNYRVKKILEAGGNIDCDSKLTQSIINADIAIANLEAPITEAINPIRKIGPHLSSDCRCLVEIKRLGFHLVTIANNHIKDYGEKGILDTIKACKDVGIDYVGGGDNLNNAALPYSITVKNKKVSVINCCEKEFSVADESHAGANALNPIKQYYSIKEAKKKSDIVIVIVHGGIEHYQYPTQRMIETYRFFIDSGADAVINHHQHCYSGYEVYNQKPIFYGLGNFCFDWKGRTGSIWNEGYLVAIDFADTITFKLIPYTQCDDAPCIKSMGMDERDRFDSKLSKINQIIQNKVSLQETFDNFAKNTEAYYKSIIGPWSNRYLLALNRRGLLPYYFPKKKWLLLRSVLFCESHFERFCKMLEDKI